MTYKTYNEFAHSEIYSDLKNRTWIKRKEFIGKWFWILMIIGFVTIVGWCIAYGLTTPSYAMTTIKERIIAQNNAQWWIIKGKELQK